VNFLVAVFFLAVGIGYLASPRFVEWTLNRDGTGRKWAALLGHKRAAFAMRYVFSLILIGFGAVILLVSLAAK